MSRNFISLDVVYNGEMVTQLTSKLIYTFFTQLLFEFLAVNCQKTSEGYCPFPSPPKNAVMSAQSYLNEFTSDGFPAFERVFFICRVGYRQTSGAPMWSICLKSGRWWPETQKAGNCTREIRTRRIECQGQFRCRKDLQCIDRKLRCDCKPDCRDGTDEVGCNNPKKMIFINPKNKKTGVITSPNYPFGYPKTEFKCRFLFFTETSYRIRLKFEEFALRGVENSKCLDYIKLSGIHDIYLRKFDVDLGGKTRSLAAQEGRKDGVMRCGKNSFGNVVSNTSRLEMQVRLAGVTSSKKNVDLKGYSLTWEVIEKEKASEIERKLEKDFRRKLTMQKKKKADRKKVEKSEKSRGNVVTILLPISISAVLPLFVITFLCYHKRYIYAYIFKSGRARSCKKSRADSNSLEEAGQGQVLGRMDEYRLKAVENSWTGKGKDRIGRTGDGDGADISGLNVVSESKLLSGQNFMTELSVVTGLDVSDQNIVSGGKFIPRLSIVTGQDFVSDGGSVGSDSGLLMVSKLPVNVGGREHEVLMGKNRLETVEKSGKQEKSERICQRRSMLGSKDDQTSVSSSCKENNQKVYSSMKANEENGHPNVSTNKQLSESLANKNLDMYINDGVKTDESNFMSKWSSKAEYDTTDVNVDGVGPRAGLCDKARKKERFHGRNSRNGNSKHCCRNSSKAEKRRVERIRDRESRRAHRHSSHREYPSRLKRIDNNEMFLDADSSRDSQQTLDSCELYELKRHSPALVAGVRRNRNMLTDSDSPVIQRQSNSSTHQHFTEETPGNCRYYSSDSGTYTGPETPCRSGSVRTESVHFLQQRDFINELKNPRYMTDSDSRESTYTETCQGCLNGYCSGEKVNAFNRIFQSNDEGLCTALEEFSAAEEYKVARALGHDLSIYERSSIKSSTLENKPGLSDTRDSIGSGLSDTQQIADNNVSDSRQGCVDTCRIIGSDISSSNTRQSIGNNVIESKYGISETDCNIGNGFLETHQSIRNDVMERRHGFVDMHHRFGSGNVGSRSSFTDARFGSIVKDRKHGSRDSSKASNSSRGSNERQSIASSICEERFVSRDSPVTHTTRGIGDYNHWHKDSTYVSGLIMHQHAHLESPESRHTSTGSVDYMLEHKDISGMIEYKHGRTDSFESTHHSQSADDFDHGNRDSPYLSGHATTRFDDRGYYTNLRPTAHSGKYQNDEQAGVRCHNDRSIVLSETTNNHRKWPLNLQHDNGTIMHQKAFVDNDSHAERFLIEEDTGDKEIQSSLIAEGTGNKERRHDVLFTRSDMDVYYEPHCQCGLCLDQAYGAQ